jgi:hypothetical protein
VLPKRTAIRLVFASMAGALALSVLVGVTLRYGLPGSAVRLDIQLSTLVTNWDGLLAAALFTSGLTLLLWAALTQRWFFERFVGSASPAALGIIRAVVCLALLQHVFYEPLESLALIPSEFRRYHGLGIMGVLDRLPTGLDYLAQSWTALLIFRWGTGVLLVLAMVGWKTRLTLWLAAASYMVFAGLLRQYSYFWHMGLIALTLMLVMIWTPCGDGFSIDRLLRTLRGEVFDANRPSVRFGWCRWFAWTALAVLYTLTGWSKLVNGGLMWWGPENMRSMLLRNALEKNILGLGLPLKLIDMPEVLLAAFGIVTLAGESLFFLVLFSKWARRMLPPLMVMMHVGILLMMDVVFIDALICQLAFINFDWLRHRLRGGHRPSVLASNLPWWGYPVGSWLLVLALTSVWFLGIEAYPFSSMQMFSERNTTGQFEYHRLYMHFGDGSSVRTYLDEVVGALHNTRFRPILKPAFRPSDRERVQRYFDALGRVYNSETGGSPRVVRYEVQKWLWDFRSDRHNPEYGRMIDRAFFEITPLATADSQR